MASTIEYRRKAEELRERALSSRDEVTRSTFLAAARSWDLLAASADQHAREVMLRALTDR